MPDGRTLVCDWSDHATHRWSILRPGWIGTFPPLEERVYRLWWVRVRPYREAVPEVILADAAAWAAACN